MSNILVTGATGFIGRPLCARLSADGALVRAAVWREGPAGNFQEGTKVVPIDSIGPDTDWTQALAGIDIIIHLAARVHVMDEKAEEPLAAYRRVNVDGTGRLARMAAANGVKRLVFLSSVKAHGVEAAHLDPYGVSKSEAEEILKRIAGETGLEVVIIRPPLVYGPGVKANFYRLIGISAQGLPLPFASVNNTRSLVYLGNLIDVVVLCAVHPLAAGRTFLVRDGEDVSTPELIRRIAGALGRPARLFPFPPALLRLAASLIGRTAAADRLLGSLSVDDGKIRKELGWKPPFTMAEGLKETAEWYMRGKTESVGVMKRIFDIGGSFVALLIFGVPMLLVALLVRLTSRGPALHWSDRVGRDNKIFKMPKFRTMLVDTPPMATHLMTEPDKFLTPLGGFLRKTSLDELPQLLSILRGDMSFVGPRPALFNQDDLISLRTAKGLCHMMPGLTGWAQVNGRDDISIPVKVEYDEYYLKHRSFIFDMKILFMTAVQALTGKGVRH